MTASEPLSSTPLPQFSQPEVQIGVTEPTVLSQATKEPGFLRSRFETDENEPGTILIGGSADFKIGVKEYGHIVSLSKSGSALALKLLRHFLTSEDLSLYSWRGTKSTSTGETMRLNIAETAVMKAIINQAKLQFHDFEVNDSFKKSVSTLCSGCRKSNL